MRARTQERDTEGQGRGAKGERVDSTNRQISFTIMPKNVRSDIFGSFLGGILSGYTLFFSKSALCSQLATHPKTLIEVLLVLLISHTWEHTV